MGYDQAMPAYMLFIREEPVQDEAAMARYRGSTSPIADVKPLVVYGEISCPEGEAADGVVLLEFPDMEAAKRWYYSDDYQQAAEWRKKAAHYRVMFLEGLPQT